MGCSSSKVDRKNNNNNNNNNNNIKAKEEIENNNNNKDFSDYEGFPMYEERGLKPNKENPIVFEALEAYFKSTKALNKENLDDVESITNDYFTKYKDNCKTLKTKTGMNLGNPACYYALKMLNMIGRELQKETFPEDKVTVNLTIIICDKSIHSKASQVDLQNKTPPSQQSKVEEVHLKLDNFSEDKQADYEWLEESFEILNNFIKAITKKRISVHCDYDQLPGYEIRTSEWKGNDNLNYSSVTQEETDKLIDEMISKHNDFYKKTDWFLVIHPDCTPRSNASNANNEDVWINTVVNKAKNGGPVFTFGDKIYYNTSGINSDKTQESKLVKYNKKEFFISMYEFWFKSFMKYLSRIYNAKSIMTNDNDLIKSKNQTYNGMILPDYYDYMLTNHLINNTSNPLHIKLLHSDENKKMLKEDKDSYNSDY